MKKPATSAARRADIGPRRYGPSADSRASARQGGGTYVPKALPEGTATPARYNRMAAPVWQPPAEPPRRAGADDHYRYASRGI